MNTSEQCIWIIIQAVDHFNLMYKDGSICGTQQESTQLVAATALTASAENQQHSQTHNPAPCCHTGWPNKSKTSM